MFSNFHELIDARPLGGFFISLTFTHCVIYLRRKTVSEKYNQSLQYDDDTRIIYYSYQPDEALFREFL